MATPALSIRQPWVELILSGKKSIEIRRWMTHYTGPVWLHASRTRDCTNEKLASNNLDYGGFVGQANLCAVTPFTESDWEELRDLHLDQGSFQQGLYAWFFCSPKRLTRAFEAPGRLKLFHPTPEEIKALESLTLNR